MPGRRQYVAVLAAAGALWLGWQIISVAVSDYHALARPEIALAWDPEHAEALRQLAEQRLSLLADQSEQQQLTALVRRAIVGEPLKAAPLRIAGLIAEEAEDIHRAETLMRMAAARSK